ncbi:MAG TPA: cytochrome c biogenesis heme-transporting ATPase CcmA [Gammaproteobacteria bacterium]|nr:cytochrome c biogenesis heme-transporting ATPase CcmA [Gammaproteobacteria bacterium]
MSGNWIRADWDVMEALEVVGRSQENEAPHAGAAGRHARVSLSLHDLELWRGDYCVCTNLTTAVHSGQLLHLRGSNGAGKTSLIRVLAGLALAEAGEVRLGGEPTTQSMTAYRAVISYVGHSNGIKRELTPVENLRVTARLALNPSTSGPESALERVGLAAHMNRYCGELSAGQRRRTALARLLVTNAPIWFLDEPLVSLDYEGAGLVEELIREHLARGGITVLATHQPIDLKGLEVVAVDLPQGRAQ